MKNSMFVINPAADRGHAGQNAPALRALAYDFGGADWQVTEYPGHAVRLARNAARHGYETIVALGGDGLIHEVVNGLMSIPDGDRPALGIVPLGSGNDMAFNSGVGMDSKVAVQRAMRGNLVSIDVGVISDTSGRVRYFCNVAGMLFDAASLIQSMRITVLRGFSMYLAAIIRAIIENYDATHFMMTVDGDVSELDLIMLTLGNGAREGGGFAVTPDAKNNDGQLDYLMVTPISRIMMLRLLPEVMRGTHARFGCVSLGSFRSMRLKADRAIPIHLDGELWTNYKDNVRQVSIEVLPGVLSLRR